MHTSKKAAPRIIAKVFIERVSDSIKVTAQTAKPGILIGPGGKKVQELKTNLKKLIKKTVHINIVEIKVPELNASLVANQIAEQIETRGSFKRAGKQAVEGAMRFGAKGIQIQMSGRLGGAEKSRKFKFLEGSVPKQTLRADIDYSNATAQTTYGCVGIKVWIFKGYVYGKRDLSLKV